MYFILKKKKYLSYMLIIGKIIFYDWFVFVEEKKFKN